MERKATEELKAAGFKGFIPVSALRERGLKMIMRPTILSQTFNTNNIIILLLIVRLKLIC